MNNNLAGVSSTPIPKLQLVTAQTLEADKRSAAAKAMMRLAKARVRAAKKAFKMAKLELKTTKKLARKARRQARRARKALQVCLKKIAERQRPAKRPGSTKLALVDAAAWPGNPPVAKGPASAMG